MASPEPGALDGRQSRTLRSRRAICDACLDLVQEGRLHPSADEVAKRAGVSRRSIFNHFADLAELYDAVVEAGIERCAPLLEKIPVGIPVAERIERVASVRARFHEATAAFTRALAVQAVAGPEAERARRVLREGQTRQHREVTALFGPELADRSAREREEVLEAASATLSPAQWEFLRRGRGLSMARSRALLERSLAAILRDAGVRV